MPSDGSTRMQSPDGEYEYEIPRSESTYKQTRNEEESNYPTELYAKSINGSLKKDDSRHRKMPSDGSTRMQSPDGEYEYEIPRSESTYKQTRNEEESNYPTELYAKSINGSLKKDDSRHRKMPSDGSTRMQSPDDEYEYEIPRSESTYKQTRNEEESNYPTELYAKSINGSLKKDDSRHRKMPSDGSTRMQSP